MYITIVGIERYLGTQSYTIGQKLILKKEIDNKFDDEAIKVESESGAMCGYVANSVSTVARGTHSAGFIYKEINASELSSNILSNANTLVFLSSILFFPNGR